MKLSQLIKLHKLVRPLRLRAAVMTYWGHQGKKANSVLFLKVSHRIVLHKVHLAYLKKLNVRYIDMYLQYPTDKSPLDWWKLECKRMPLLSVLAHKYLSLCATSVPSERVFSIAGHLVSKEHSSL